MRWPVSDVVEPGSEPVFGVVVKLGGAALRDGAAVGRSVRALERVGGARPVVVVSALEGVTRLLERAALADGERDALWNGLRVRHRTLLRQLGLAGDALDRHLGELRAVLRSLPAGGQLTRRQRDYVLSFGERMSARILASCLRSGGRAAVALDAYDLGLSVDEPWDRIVQHERERIRRTLAGLDGIPVLTGFLARDGRGGVATLGWNGSDLSACWIAAVVGAREVVFGKTVAGVHSADPRRVPAARRFAQLAYDDAALLTAHGSVVLHPRAIEPARNLGLHLRILNVEDLDAGGTTIAPGAGSPSWRALAHRDEVQLLRLTLERREGFAAALARLADDGHEVVQAALGASEARFLVSGTSPVGAFAAFAGDATLESGLATLSLLGAGVEREHAAVRRQLADADVDVWEAPGGSGERERVLLLRGTDLECALTTAHAAWVEQHDRSAVAVSLP